MSITPGYTNDEIRELVYHYDRQPYGTKGTWVQAHNLSRSTLNRWRAAVYDGNLDHGLVPRDTRTMDSSSPAARRAIARHQHDKDRRIAELEKRIAELEESNKTFQRSNDALGKAIGLLHEISAQGPDDDQETPASSTS